LSRDVVKRARALDACSVSDAMDALGLASGVLAGPLPVWEGARAAGRAITTQLVAGPPPGARVAHLAAAAIERATADDLIVIATDAGTSMGSWGGLLSTAASVRSIAGVVTNGACRDVDEARDLRFPVFAARPALRTARARASEISSGQPVTIDGVLICSGDLVVADGSGVVIVRAAYAADVLVRAEEISAKERAMQQSLRNGVPVTRVLGGEYEHMLGPNPGLRN
jgi:4-hydroxy-4-methyl-2-oxoglutarate aldolase